MTLAAPLLVCAGFACLALSMRRHHAQVFRTLPDRRRAIAWRAAGWGLLGLALLLCLARDGAGVGLVTWTGLLTLGAPFVSLLLARLFRAGAPPRAEAKRK